METMNIQGMVSKLRMMASIGKNSEERNFSYECSTCNDTGWVEGANGYRRCECEDIKHIKRMWEHSGIKPEDKNFRLNDYKPYDDVTKLARDKAINYIQSFDDLKEHRNNSIGMFGQAGAGKTHMAISIGIALLNRKEHPISVVYMPYIEASRELKTNAMEEDNYRKLFNRYTKAKVLIIDDLFKDRVKKNAEGKKYVVPLTEADMKHIYPILNYRYANRLPMIISSECTPYMLNELDEALAGRIIECCGSNITVFNNSKYNYRMRDFK